MGEKGEDKERSIYIYVHRNLDSGIPTVRLLVPPCGSSVARIPWTTPTPMLSVVWTPVTQAKVGKLALPLPSVAVELCLR
ncbi:hypothetical protein QQP08_023059 [Theobroma cacao]|nr:hypothetical protein QQP08_023059 [Theobroma cacao]